MEQRFGAGNGIEAWSGQEVCDGCDQERSSPNALIFRSKQEFRIFSRSLVAQPVLPRMSESLLSIKIYPLTISFMKAFVITLRKAFVFSFSVFKGICLLSLWSKNCRQFFPCDDLVWQRHRGTLAQLSLILNRATRDWLRGEGCTGGRICVKLVVFYYGKITGPPGTQWSFQYKYATIGFIFTC